MKRALASWLRGLGWDTLAGAAMASMAAVLALGAWAYLLNWIADFDESPWHYLRFDFWWHHQTLSLKDATGGSFVLCGWAILAIWLRKRPSRMTWTASLVLWAAFSDLSLFFLNRRIIRVALMQSMGPQQFMRFDPWLMLLVMGLEFSTHAVFYWLLFRRWWIVGILFACTVLTNFFSVLFELTSAIQSPAPFVVMRSVLAHAIIAAGFARWVSVSRREQRLRAGGCPLCGYSLAGLPSATCPECGRG